MMYGCHKQLILLFNSAAVSLSETGDHILIRFGFINQLQWQSARSNW